MEQEDRVGHGPECKLETGGKKARNGSRWVRRLDGDMEGSLAALKYTQGH